MKNNGTTAAPPDELNAKLNGMLKEIMGKRTASTIAKKCGVSVSTITRIRNGENKRGISEELLHKIWMTKDDGCDIDLSTLLSVNSEVSTAYMQKENAGWDQERQELDFLERQIQKNMLNSGFFLRKTNERFEIIPEVDLFPEMSYEIAFESGEIRRVLVFTQFHTKRKLERFEKAKTEDLVYSPLSCRHYRTIMDFEELRKLHPRFENSELLIVFNYEDDFRYNAENLKKLSNRDRVSLALMHYDTERLARSGRFLEEICLDDRKQGILTELGLIDE